MTTLLGALFSSWSESSMSIWCSNSCRTCGSQHKIKMWGFWWERKSKPFCCISDLKCPSKVSCILKWWISKVIGWGVLCSSIDEFTVECAIGRWSLIGWIGSLRAWPGRGHSCSWVLCYLSLSLLPRNGLSSFSLPRPSLMPFLPWSEPTMD